MNTSMMVERLSENLESPPHSPLPSCAGPVVDRSRDWLASSIHVALLLTCGWALSHNLADSDFWGHVRFGQDLLAQGLPATTTYTYTAEGHPWINHENLSELLMASGVEWLGPGGLVAIQTLLGMLILHWMYCHGQRQGVGVLPMYVCLLLVTLNLMHSWTLRPQLLTYLFFSLMILIFEQSFAGWRSPWAQLIGRPRTDTHQTEIVVTDICQLRWLWLLVPLMIAWTNAHGGFVAGYCILSTYLVGRACEALVRFGRAGLPIAGRCLACWLVCGLATLVNPYGVGLHQWISRVMGTPWREIVEWNPPELMSRIGLFWMAMLAVALLAMVWSRRRRDLVQLTILLVTTWQACEHRRHIVFFALLFGFWMPVHVASAFERLQGSARATATSLLATPRARWSLAGTLGISSCLLICLLVGRWRQIPVERSQYPVSAFKFMTDRHLQGNLVVRFKWSQYAIAAFGPANFDRPQVRVAFDGRLDTCYPQEVVDMYFDFAIGNAPPSLRSRAADAPPVDSSRILNFKDPTLVLIDRAQRYAVSVMQAHRDEWTLLYQDSMAQLWGRRELYDNPQSDCYLPPTERAISDVAQIGSIPWPAFPIRDASPHPETRIAHN
jgi:hypothetical protein